LTTIIINISLTVGDIAICITAAT